MTDYFANYVHAFQYQVAAEVKLILCNGFNNVDANLCFTCDCQTVLWNVTLL